MQYQHVPKDIRICLDFHPIRQLNTLLPFLFDKELVLRFKNVNWIFVYSSPDEQRIQGDMEELSKHLNAMFSVRMIHGVAILLKDKANTF